MTLAHEVSARVRDTELAATAQRVFFLAMQAGYVNDPKKTTISELPGSKSIELNYGKWRVLDVYAVTPRSDMSAGTTHIWYENVPVWMMQYMGEYPEAAIATLMRALAGNYAQSVWNGGRGPAFYDGGEFCYENNVDPGSEFAGRSSGEEFMMRRCGGGVVGWHRYQSIWML